jgi:hypothetical protein
MHHVMPILCVWFYLEKFRAELTFEYYNFTSFFFICDKRVIHFKVAEHCQELFYSYNLILKVSIRGGFQSTNLLIYGDLWFARQVTEGNICGWKARH